MSVRVVARIRPLLEKEVEKQQVIVARGQTKDGRPVVKIPNPKNEAEVFRFKFNSVYDHGASQEDIFGAEVSPHIKSLFSGIDLTLFAYGVTGTGKTHTMRGGLKLAERGLIPRLLSNIFRRAKKINSTNTESSTPPTTVKVSLSYYEIYNDKIHDLLEPSDKRTPAGLPIRENVAGKTVVVGLSERECSSIKDFEKLYIEANTNRATASTKLNAHSSRSHAILRVKLRQTTGSVIRESTASAIDLAGSEDNRRTDNKTERIIESAAINKSLFVLSQCIDAIGRGDKRVPYRESKMTRILELGQRKGVVVMVLNLAPGKAWHLDTLSSLNVSSRAKRIEVREIENEVVFRQVPRAATPLGAGLGAGLGGLAGRREALRPIASLHNELAGAIALGKEKEREGGKSGKPPKAFVVFSDKAAAPQSKGSAPGLGVAMSTGARTVLGPKGSSELEHARVHKSKTVHQQRQPLGQKLEVAPISAADIDEALVEKKVVEILDTRGFHAPLHSPLAFGNNVNTPVGFAGFGRDEQLASTTTGLDRGQTTRIDDVGVGVAPSPTLDSHIGRFTLPVPKLEI